MRKLFAALAATLCAVAQTPTRTVWDAVYTSEQATRGEALYTSTCAGCHGNSLQGGESAPPLSGVEFFSNWNTLSVGDLFERVRVSMPLNKPGSLNREQNAAIVAYVLRFSKFPAGSAELPQRTEMLNDIRIEMYKPEVKK
ncbi:MAG: c-type cytochrome [Acidobacteriota bacterium]